MGRLRWIGWMMAVAGCVTGFGQDREYGRSMVISQGGIVAASQVLASQAGAAMLERGGTAVDAAIAANAVLGVTEPMMDGIGGDLFVIYREASTGKVYGLNASGWAPRGLTPAFLAKKGLEKMPRDGIHTVTVPGCVAGWAALHARFGALPWRDLLQPAIRLAREGFPVAEAIQGYWERTVKMLDRDEGDRALFLPGGKPPRVGQVFRNEPLARTLERIAEEGPEAFYRGSIARAILGASRRLGGAMAAEDLSEYEPEWIEPISTTYRGWKVYEMPPNVQGIGVLEMLNIMETRDLAKLEPHSAEALHWKIEAMRLAYADLRRWVADPRFAPVPAAGLASKEYGKRQAARIDPAKASCDPAPGEPQGPGNTTYLASVDRQGNIASWIQSVSGVFGSAVVVEGFHLHNRGAGFVLEPDHPNVLAGRKRPFHTIIPALMVKDKTAIGFGIMGGPNQPLAHAQFVSHVVDHGMHLQAALEAPRFTKRTGTGCDVALESRVPAAARRQLEKMGHKVDVKGSYSASMGFGQAVMHDPELGVNFGASSPRTDGAAIPEAVFEQGSQPAYRTTRRQ